MLNGDGKEVDEKASMNHMVARRTREPGGVGDRGIVPYGSSCDTDHGEAACGHPLVECMCYKSIWVSYNAFD
jgi:hypothetical protein